jgi:HAE1 family hydrophobic/amphiphilic exporter-1
MPNCSLREITEQVRDDLLLIPQISQAEITGERKFQIDVEIPEKTLREYGLTLTDVSRRIRLRNLELPGGTIRDQGETYLLRGKDKRVLGDEIAAIPLITRADGVVLTVGELGKVKDEFVDTTSISRINGQPGLAIDVSAASREDLLAMADAVKEYVKQKELPPGYKFSTWGDSSIEVRDRLDLLVRNGMQGLILVFVILSMFLDLKLAFWVALGIPISLLGACAVLWQFDQTLNMLSLFSFLIALGIVVDDAIVVGENVYAHRAMGKSPMQAAIDGTIEVVPSVFSSVATTVFAFVPMFFVTGVMGKFFAVMPLAVIAILLVSLLEASFVLPCHLAHGSGKPSSLTSGLNRLTNWVLDTFIARIYQPVIRFCIGNPAITVSMAISFLLLTASLVSSGTVPSIFFPKLDAPEVMAKVIFPDGTPSRVTEHATERIEKAILEINKKYSTPDRPLMLATHRMVGLVKDDAPGGGQTTEGSHAGSVYAQLVDSGLRDLKSEEVVQEWRNAVGPIAGVETLTFGSQSRGPGGKPIEFKLLGPSTDMKELEAAVEEVKTKLATYKGVFDVSDDSRPGKWELQLREKENAVALGVPLESIARTVRASYYGEEVMRLQRGRHEVKLMVRYPEEDRKSLARFDDIRVDGGDGVQRPITELADVSVSRGYSEINRIDQKRSITISSDIDEKEGNAKGDCEQSPEDVYAGPSEEISVSASSLGGTTGAGHGIGAKFGHRSGDRLDRHVRPADDGVHILWPANGGHGDYPLRHCGSGHRALGDGPAADVVQHAGPCRSDRDRSERLDCSRGLYQQRCAWRNAVESGGARSGRSTFPAGDADFSHDDCWPGSHPDRNIVSGTAGHSYGGQFVLWTDDFDRAGARAGPDVLSDLRQNLWRHRGRKISGSDRCHAGA